jgi:predicted XRE-type DNA-binding protein
MTEPFASVWDAVTDTPEESANMKVRADLTMAIVRRVRGWGVTQQTAARRLGITQPRLSELLGGKITKFSLDALVSLADRSDLPVNVVAVRIGPRKPVRGSLRRSALTKLAA